MLQKISSEIKEILNNFSEEDKIIFNNELIDVNRDNFQEILKGDSDKTITFVDGGQAEIISTGNFCLSFIRIFAQTFKNNKKTTSHKNEFYLFTKSKWINDDLFYESKIFTKDDKLIDEKDLFVSSNDQTIKTGLERASISKISNMARRFAELSLAEKIVGGKAPIDFVILDGTLDKTFKNEEKYLSKLKENVCALAKTSSLFTTSGNSPVILLNKIGLSNCWSYYINKKSFFVKLHEKAKHVFRFEGNKEVLPLLIQNSNDALFLGYPYGLIFADKFARVSNEEKNSLKTSFLLRSENKEIVSYLNSTNAHEILDGFD